jgi:hydroxymethylglutaryl-CoA synthase
MSSEPIERRFSYVSDRLRGSKCNGCGKEYPSPVLYCTDCGRKSFEKMSDTNYFFKKGTLDVCALVEEPTNRFVKLGPFVHGTVYFGNDIRLPGRLTDILIKGDTYPAQFEGREVVPRFRRRYSVKRNEIIPTISLAFTFADEYYPYQDHEIRKPKKEYERPGLVGFGVYTSRFRIKEGSIERSVPFLDEDAVTAAVESGKLALIQTGIDNTNVCKVYAGSESNPYAVKPIASKVAQVLDLGKKEDGGLRAVDAIDTEFACKAASSMFKDAIGVVSLERSLEKDNEPKYAMVIGTDNSQAAPRDEPGGELDFFVGYGAASFIFGTHDVIAELEGYYSCTSDTPDFWRRDREAFPSHGGRFTGEPAYFKHVKKAAQRTMEKLNLKPSDIKYFVTHQPNMKFPVEAAKSLGFKEEQFMPGLKVSKFGNTYSGCSPIGLAAILEIAKPDERILVASYGSGAGSDGYSFITTQQITGIKERQKFTVQHQSENNFLEFVDYDTYRRLKIGI